MGKTIDLLIVCCENRQYAAEAEAGAVKKGDVVEILVDSRDECLIGRVENVLTVEIGSKAHKFIADLLIVHGVKRIWRQCGTGGRA